MDSSYIEIYHMYSQTALHKNIEEKAVGNVSYPNVLDTEENLEKYLDDLKEGALVNLYEVCIPSLDLFIRLHYCAA